MFLFYLQPHTHTHSTLFTVKISHETNEYISEQRELLVSAQTLLAPIFPPRALLGHRVVVLEIVAGKRGHGKQVGERRRQLKAVASIHMAQVDVGGVAQVAARASRPTTHTA